MSTHRHRSKYSNDELPTAEHLIDEIFRLARKMERLAKEIPASPRTNVLALQRIFNARRACSATRIARSLLLVIEELHEKDLAVRQKACFEYWCDITS